MEDEMKGSFEVYYNHKSPFGKGWVAGSRRFTDWYDFADWLKQLNEAGNAVLITSWNYL